MMFFRFMCILFLLAIIQAGCSQEQQNPIREYGDTLVKSLDKAEMATLKMNLRTIETAIDRFEAEKGRLPESLDELKLSTISTEDYDYNPDTGSVEIAVE